MPPACRCMQADSGRRRFLRGEVIALVLLSSCLLVLSSHASSLRPSLLGGADDSLSGLQSSHLAFSYPPQGLHHHFSHARACRISLRSETSSLRAPATTRGEGVLGMVAQMRGRGRGGRGGGGRGGRGRGGRGAPIVARSDDSTIMNDDIPFSEVRVVLSNPDGRDDMLGIMSKEEALAQAEEKGQDLVLISPDAKPPVCKIINYDKLRYENLKREKMKKKNSKNAELKEVKLSYKIDVHDYEVRKRATVKFLMKGDKVKASIRFKGREVAHQRLAESTFARLMEDTKEFCTVEKKPMMEGRQMQMILCPLPEIARAAEKLKKEKKAKNKGKSRMGDEEEDSEDEDEDEDEIAAGMDIMDDDTEEEFSIDYDIDSISLDEVNNKIKEVGERVRTMKSDGKSKDEIAPHVSAFVFNVPLHIQKASTVLNYLTSVQVDELLALKARFQAKHGLQRRPTLETGKSFTTPE
eukprot:758184-Hanusia_phi.AAC.17